MTRARGFTLIELMIVVGIMAILASIAIPSYSEYVRRSRITEAVSALSGMRVKMEQYFQDNRTYAGACAAAPSPRCPRSTRQQLRVRLPDAQRHQLRRSRPGPELDDRVHVHPQRPERARDDGRSDRLDPTANCWVLKKDGSC